MTAYTVSSGQTSSGITLSSGDIETVLSGGSATSTTINDGGLLSVLAAGFANSTTINSGGSETVVGAGGLAKFNTINGGGSVTLSAGGSAFADTINSGGSVTVLSGGSAFADTIESGGSETVLSGGVASVDGILSGGSETLLGGLGDNNTISNGGSETVLAGGVAFADVIKSGGGETVVSGGFANSTTIAAGGLLTVFSGGTTSAATISGTGAVLDLLSGAIVGGGITFAGGGGQLQIFGSAMPSNTISGFVAGDTFDLASIPVVSGGSANLVTSGSVQNQLQITQGGTTYNLQLDPAQNFAGEFFHLGPDSASGTLVTEDQNPCYCRGTLILTERGEVPVEDLAIGDRVVTLSGMARPIKWIGRRSYDGRFALGQRHILPVCIEAGALGDGVPRRDLWLSPNHALYLEGVLIEARDLVNDVSVFQAERVAAIDYFHIELDSHDVILAEGAHAESFVDDDSRFLFHNAHEYRVLYPGAAAGPARYCAPRRDQGYAVERARTRIARRAGLAVTAEAPLGRLHGQIVANRHRADLMAAGLGSFRHGFEFILPAGLAVMPGSVAVRRSRDGARLTCPATEQKPARRAP